MIAALAKGLVMIVCGFAALAAAAAVMGAAYVGFRVLWQFRKGLFR
jgi:hypothetical protein